MLNVPVHETKPLSVFWMERLSSIASCLPNLSQQAAWHCPCSEEILHRQNHDDWTSKHNHKDLIPMLFLITYRKKHASSKSRKSFFAAHDDQPSVEQIQALVNSVSRGDFAEKTVALQKCQGFDTDDLIKAGITVLRFEPEAKLDGTGAAHEPPTRSETR